MNLLAQLQHLIHTSDLAQLSGILWVVMIITAIIKLCKQPLIIWYLIAGVIVGPLFLWLIDPTTWPHGHTFIQLFSHLGISLLLFMVWVGLNLDEIKEQGKTALGVGMIQILACVGVGYLMSIVLWYDISTSIFIAIWLTFSSTIVIVKLLTDKEENETTYGKNAIWVLIVQDLVVMLVMILIALMWNRVGVEWAGQVLFLEWFVLLCLVILSAKYLLPKIVKRLATEQEFLVLVGIGYCLILGTLFQLVGFSFETGCLLAGMSFATSPFRMQLTSKLTPLRDFFLVLFFIGMWLNLSRDGLDQHIPLLIGSLILVILIKPIIIYIASVSFWYTHQVSYKTASSLGQISEFGFIILAIGLSLWYVTDESLMSVMVLVWLISIAISSYLTMHNNEIYERIHAYLWADETFSTEEIGNEELERVEAILFGYGRMWTPIAALLDQQHISHVVIDHNPELIAELEERPGEYIFADASNVEVYKHMFHDELRYVISTTRDLEDDLFIIDQIQNYISSLTHITPHKNTAPHITIIVVSHDPHHAQLLRDAGADYVIMPDELGARSVGEIVEG